MTRNHPRNYIGRCCEVSVWRRADKFCRDSPFGRLPFREAARRRRVGRLFEDELSERDLCCHKFEVRPRRLRIVELAPEFAVIPFKCCTGYLSRPAVETDCRELTSSPFTRARQAE